MTSEAGVSATLSPLLVLPTYNEAGTVEEVVRLSFEAVPELTILVVDDGSSDGTVDVVKSLISSKVGAIHVLERPSKLGLGSAYRAGFEWGLDLGFGILIEMDADLQHDPLVLANLIEKLNAGADLVIGSRYVDGGGIEAWSAGRRFISRGGNVAAQLVLGMPISDSTSGFRGFKADLLRSIEFSEVKSDGYSFQVEMAFLSHQRNANIVEIPIAFRDRLSGESKMDTGIAVEAALLLARLGSRRVTGRRTHLV